MRNRRSVQPYSQDYLIRRDLQDRGWTDAMIGRFLPQPDKTCENPHYRCAANMRLYCLNRVIRIEKSVTFRKELEKSADRKQAAKKAVATKAAKTRKHVEQDVEITVPEMSKEKLIAAACDHYNAMQMGRENGHWTCASPDSDEEFLDRITVNFLRHEMTRYHHHLYEVRGRVGCEDACLAIREKANDAIADKYPWLMIECGRQDSAAIRRQMGRN